MKNTKLSELSTQDLINKEKSLKLLTGMLIGMLFALFVLSLYLTVTKEFSPLLIMPFALLPIVVINFSTIKNIKKELNSRTNP